MNELKKVYFVDGDGTLFLGYKPMTGTIEAIAKLQQHAKVFYLTNNSSKTPMMHLAKLKALGFDFTLEEVLTSTDALIDGIKERDVFLVANEKVASHFRSCLFWPQANEERCKAVVLTYDTELTYAKLARACELLRNPDVAYYATHSDMVCPTEGGFIPDIGTFIGAIQEATGREPDKVFGKPSPNIIAPTIAKLGVKYSDCAMIGDRLYTDIALARMAKIQGILVLSGETKETEARTAWTTFKPDIITKDIAEYVASLDI